MYIYLELFQMTTYINYYTLSPKFIDTKSKKAALFDLDGTIIKPIGTNKFSLTDSDWIFENDQVIPFLKKLYNDGFDIIIVSNQKKLKDPSLWKNKIEIIANKINIPLFALASLSDDEFRKPRIGLWNKFLSKYDKDKSFYCGDAGGLPKRKLNGIMVNKDFADSDLKFALNIGIKFYHRDEYFYNVSGIKLIPSYINFDNIKRGSYNDININGKTIVINIGFPGSGKSYFSKNHIKSSSNNIVYINRDSIGNIKKCIKLCEQSMNDGLPIIIDNTNPSIADRKQFIDIAKLHKYNIICINFTTSKDLSMHNNVYRAIINKTEIIPKIVYNMFTSKYVKPSKDEGFNEIHMIDFVLNDKNCDNEYFRYYY